MKRVLRILALFCIFIGIFTLGMFSRESVNKRVVAEVVAHSYLMGCVQAKTEIFGITSGIIYKQCYKKARIIYNRMLKIQEDRRIELKQPI